MDPNLEVRGYFYHLCSPREEHNGGLDNKRLNILTLNEVHLKCLSSHPGKYIFVLTWKTRFEFRIIEFFKLLLWNMMVLGPLPPSPPCPLGCQFRPQSGCVLVPCSTLAAHSWTQWLSQSVHGGMGPKKIPRALEVGLLFSCGVVCIYNLILLISSFS